MTGAAAALTLGTVSFSNGPAAEAADNQETKTVRGTLPTGSPDFVYLPVDVPEGVREIKVSYTYDRPSVPAGTQANALDIGVFDERGTELAARASAAGPAARARSSSSARTTPPRGTSRARSAPAPGTSRSARTRWRRRA